MYVCSCFGITEQQVKQHADDGACTPRQIASACKAGTDCGGCVRRIQALLGRGECPRRGELIDGGARPAALPAGAPVALGGRGARLSDAA
ncbi:bacterioferritin-associated ferredoxin [Streptomyces sp. B1I3]|uniref:(2Fe-2S)-binding protein n=1 Tax=Streptomyces sp. B1I3 TaxID=3042264 RepID=UPI00278A775F|nr:(2Fe-2S)-binding protein [Streptomyces sp. B1I3]MDQ0796825.1 bacterioferritin-associated ferredoxin [Streptomyces sp. B1I3]